MATRQAPTTEADSNSRRLWVRKNRILIALALLAIAFGILYGQAFITWLNATLL